MSGFLHRQRFRLDHRWAPGRMSDYMDQDLPPTGRVRMERHLGECAECRRLLAGLRRTLDAVHRLVASDAGVSAVEIAASVRARLTERE